ncbi:hypothetical protein O3G_MSEX011750, partial [Manduca sexta]
MRVTAFVILCCALQYVTSDDIEKTFNDLERGYKETSVRKSDEFNVKNGTMFETSRVRKQFERDGAKPNIDPGEKMFRTLMIETDASGHETIFEEDVVIKRVPGATDSASEGSLPTSAGSSGVSMSAASASTSFGSGSRGAHGPGHSGGSGARASAVAAATVAGSGEVYGT